MKKKSMFIVKQYNEILARQHNKPETRKHEGRTYTYAALLFILMLRCTFLRESLSACRPLVAADKRMRGLPQSDSRRL